MCNANSVGAYVRTMLRYWACANGDDEEYECARAGCVGARTDQVQDVASQLGVLELVVSGSCQQLLLPQ